MTLGSMCCAGVMAGAIALAPGMARGDTAPASVPPHRTIVFSPDRPERCDYFFVTEFDVGVTGAKLQDAIDQYLFTDALGLMRNVGGTRAVGISVDAHLSGGAVRFVPTIRAKQWLGGRSSIDIALGYANVPIEQEGVVGMIASVRYSPNQWFHLQATGCRTRDVRSIYYYPELRVEQNTRFRVYGGVGLAGVPAVISWGAQAIGMVALVAALSGMN